MLTGARGAAVDRRHDPDVLTPLQAARALGVTLPRVQELIDCGLLQRVWRSHKAYVRGAARLIEWRAANVAPWCER